MKACLPLSLALDSAVHGIPIRMRRNPLHIAHRRRPRRERPRRAAGTAGSHIRPTIDAVPRVLGQCGRRRPRWSGRQDQLDDAELYDGMSTWYRLPTSTAVPACKFEHSPCHRRSGIGHMRFETIAWRLANEVVDPQNRSTASDHLPLWAHVRTGNTDGPSAGLIMASPTSICSHRSACGDPQWRAAPEPDRRSPSRKIDVGAPTAMLMASSQRSSTELTTPTAREEQSERGLHRGGMAQCRIRTSRPSRGRPSSNSSGRRP
jgi:hypothetical protein